MVAYTTPNCLPYFEGPEDICLNTGSACEPSTVWCDLAALVDAKLTAYSDTVNQSIASFPYAEVALTALPYTIDSGGSSGASQLAVWDAVIGDSDNIVDLGADPSTFYLRRSGIWQIRAAATWRSSFSQTQMSIGLVAPPAPKLVLPATYGQFDRIWVEPVPDPGDTVGGSLGLTTTLDMYVLIDTTTGPAPLSLTFLGFANGAFILTIEQALASVQWIAELP